MLLQDIVNASDLLFRVTDVLLLGGGVISIITTYFVLKYKVDRNEEMLANHLKDFESEKIMIHNRIDDTKEKMESISKEINEVKLAIVNFKAELFQLLLNEKKGKKSSE